MNNHPYEDSRANLDNRLLEFALARHFGAADARPASPLKNQIRETLATRLAERSRHDAPSASRSLAIRHRLGIAAALLCSIAGIGLLLFSSSPHGPRDGEAIAARTPPAGNQPATDAPHALASDDVPQTQSLPPSVRRVVRNLADIEALPSGCTNVAGEGLSDGELAALAAHASIKKLDLSQMRIEGANAIPLEITDAGVSKLAALTSLQHLDLGNCRRVTGECLAALAPALTRLEWLNLSRTGIRGELCGPLKDMPALESLTLVEAYGLGDAGLTHIARAINLEQLFLNGCYTVTAAGASELRALVNLRHLKLDNCSGLSPFSSLGHKRGDGVGVNDGALTALSTLSKLEQLSLRGCHSVTNAGARRLSKFGSLKRLNLRGTAVNGYGDFFEDNKGLQLLEELDIAEMKKLHRAESDATCTTPQPPMVGRIVKQEHLHTLDLEWSDIDDAGVSGIARRVASLRKLNLSYCTSLTEACAGAFAPMPNLRSLNLFGLKWVSDTTIEQIAAAGNLEELDIGACGELTDAGLAKLIACKNLRKLGLQANANLTLAGLEKLAGLELREVNVSSAQGLSDAEVKALADRIWPAGCTVRLPGGNTHTIPADAKQADAKPQPE